MNVCPVRPCPNTVRQRGGVGVVYDPSLTYTRGFLMAKAKKAESETTEEPRIYKLRGDIKDKLKGAGFQELWTVKPKTQRAVLSGWMSMDRRFVIVQQFENGRTMMFEEVSDASFWQTGDGAA